MKTLFLPVLAVLLFSSCNSDKSADKKDVMVPEKMVFDLAPVRMAITAANQMWSDAVVKNDKALFTSLYTKDGCLMPAGGPKLCGAEGVGGFYDMAKKNMALSDAKITTEEVMGGPDVVVETGVYELFGAKHSSLDHGKYLVAWKQEDGKWKMHRDIFTSSVEPPMPKK